MSVSSGWGRFTWGQANWNESTTLKTGWGAQAWNGGGAWGQTSNQVITLTGQSITSSLGTPSVPDVVLSLTGQQITSSQGEGFVPVVIETTLSTSLSVGAISPIEMTVGLTTQSMTAFLGTPAVADVVGLTGLDITSSQGDVTIPNDTVQPSGQSMTLSQGTAQGISSQEATLTGQSATVSLGTVTIPNDTVLVSGFEAVFTQGSIIGLGGAVVNPTAQTVTSSVGSLTVEEGLGLTGQSFSASVGTISVVDMQVGLTGQSMTFSIGTPIIFAYGDIDTGQNNSYSDVPTGSNGTYSNVATGTNNSYNDVAA